MDCQADDFLNCSYHKAKQCQVCLADESLSSQSEKKKLILSQKIHFPVAQIHTGDAYRFRNKMKLQIGGTQELPLLGFVDPVKLKVLHDLTSCPLHHEFLEKLIPKVKELIQKASVPPYDIQERQGEAKGIIAFYSPTSQESYLRIVLRSKESLDRIKKHLSLFDDVTVVSLNIQPTPHALIEGEEEIYLKGEKVLHRFFDKSLYLSPRGFVQTNTSIAEKLYQSAATWVSSLSLSKAVDLYCGHGPFAFFLNSLGLKTLGVEVNPSAVELAKLSAADFTDQDLRPEFVCASAPEMKTLINQFQPDLILVNPPRAGLRSGVELIKESACRYLLYSSCSHDTLAIDLNALKGSFKILKAEIFDMFPHSIHFESLVLLERIETEK